MESTLKSPRKGYYRCSHCGYIYEDEVRDEASICRECGATQASIEPFNEVVRKRALNADFVSAGSMEKVVYDEVKEKVGFRDIAAVHRRRKFLTFGLVVGTVLCGSLGGLLYQTYKKHKIIGVSPITEAKLSKKLTRREQQELLFSAKNALRAYQNFISTENMYAKMSQIYDGEMKADQLRAQYAGGLGLAASPVVHVAEVRSSRTGFLEVIVQLESEEVILLTFVQVENFWLLDWLAAGTGELQRISKLRFSKSEESAEFRLLVKEYMPEFYRKQNEYAVKLGQVDEQSGVIKSDMVAVMPFNSPEAIKLRESIEAWDFYRANFEEAFERDQTLAGRLDPTATGRVRVEVAFTERDGKRMPVIKAVNAAHWLDDYETSFVRPELEKLRTVVMSEAAGKKATSEERTIEDGEAEAPKLDLETKAKENGEGDIIPEAIPLEMPESAEESSK